MEKEVRIPTSQRKFIYGKLRGSLKQPLVIFVHGLGAWMEMHLYYNGSRYLEKHGFASFRFNLYGYEKDARKLGECTLKTHALDLDTVIEYFRKKGVKKIFVVGHSYGGPTILFSKKKDFDGVVFWDASYGDPLSFENVKYNKELDAFIAVWNFGIVLNKKMVQEGKTLKQKEEQLIQEIRVPIKIIVAGKGLLVTGGKEYYQLANEPKELAIVQGADHIFAKGDTLEVLLKETLSWLQRYRRYRSLQ